MQGRGGAGQARPCAGTWVPGRTASGQRAGAGASGCRGIEGRVVER